VVIVSWLSEDRRVTCEETAHEQSIASKNIPTKKKIWDGHDRRFLPAPEFEDSECNTGKVRMGEESFHMFPVKL
jgi:hypothetical protein